jgi:peptide/nickel transport system substrate-binding protein
MYKNALRQTLKIALIFCLVSGMAVLAGERTSGPGRVSFYKPAPRLTFDRKTTGSSKKKLFIGSSVFPPTLDPTANAAQAIDEVIDYNVLQHLVELAPNGTIVPVLASKWKTSDNGTLYTFTVRQGVHFSNGDLLTPADVVFSIDRVLKDPSYPYRDIFDVKSAKVVGSDEVAVRLIKKSWSFLFDMAAYSNGVILDPPTVKTLATDPIGTGPYVVTGEVNNYSVSLGINHRYFGELPNVGGVEFRYFSNPATEDTALLTGQINVIDDLATPSDISLFSSNPKKYVLISGLSNGKVQLTINNAVGPFKNKLVRQALEYAINKQEVIDVAAGGKSIAIGSDSVPADPYYINLANYYKYDVTKAKALLNQAGYPNGFSTTLTLPPYYYAQLAGPIIQQELAAIGVTVHIQQVSWPLWLSKVFYGGNFDLTIIDHAEARDVANYANSKYYWHFAGSAKVAQQLAQANASPTKTGWVKGMHQILEEITAAAVNVWLYVLPVIEVHDKGIIGLPRYGYSESFDLTHVSFGGKLTKNLISQGYSTR